ncbi:MAG TPA: ABC transporter ATP-binding protein [Thermoanaerobaculia bacterium]|nr:ABC transporter ATP-binding protein [Thermoanaerobaculia bacterium]
MSAAGQGAAAPLVAARGVAWEAGGRCVVGPLDLEVTAGECLVIVGPNGAGKTSLIRLLTGLLEPSAGGLAWRGTAYGEHSRRDLARRIAYVPQIRPARVPLTVEEVVLLGRHPHLGRFQLAPRPEDHEAVAEALDRVGIGALRQRPVDELSGGERQSVYIAAAFAQQAELLVLDEPTTHLDPRHQGEVASLLARLARGGDRTVVAASHDLTFAALVADRLVALAEGRIVADGTPAEILRPEVLESLFGSRFELVGSAERPVPVLVLDGEGR